MVKGYFCPYCSPAYQTHKTRADGVKICESCGDPLVKKSIISLKRVISLIAVFAFISPLIIILVSIFDSFNNKSSPSYSSEIKIFNKDKVY
tara:strand:+ start:1830 stop:2102 length:273 start_codon:yes stop_codon:yes gene_type:complete